MKSILYILSICFVLDSCSGDDDNGDPNAFNEPKTAGFSYSISQTDFITNYLFQTEKRLIYYIDYYVFLW